jgi:hypothetical protein
MNGKVKEQRLRMKKVNAQKVNTAKTQADRSCKNLPTQSSHVFHLDAAVFNTLESEFLVLVKNGAVH